MLSLSDISKLKNDLLACYGAELHFHDVCPKPFFTLDKVNADIKEYISGFLKDRNMKADFSGDGTQFSAERDYYA